MNAVTRSVLGAALAAGVMYMLDPVSGRSRRVLLRERCGRIWRKSQKQIDATAQGVERKLHAGVEKAQATAHDAVDLGHDFVDRVRAGERQG